MLEQIPNPHCGRGTLPAEERRHRLHHPHRALHRHAEGTRLGKYAFEMARFLPDGAENPAFVLNQPRYRGAQILVCGEFFGTGSSREMAVWALAGMGIRCLIAPSYGQIFYGNCFQNGLLPIVLSSSLVNDLMREAEEARTFEIDLEKQTHQRRDPLRDLAAPQEDAARRPGRARPHARAGAEDRRLRGRRPRAAALDLPVGRWTA